MPNKKGLIHCHQLVMVTFIKVCLSAPIWPCSRLQAPKVLTTPTINVRASMTPSRARSSLCNLTEMARVKTDLATTAEIFNIRDNISKFQKVNISRSSLTLRMSVASTVWKVFSVPGVKEYEVEEQMDNSTSLVHSRRRQATTYQAKVPLWFILREEIRWIARTAKSRACSHQGEILWAGQTITDSLSWACVSNRIHNRDKVRPKLRTINKSNLSVSIRTSTISSNTLRRASSQPPPRIKKRCVSDRVSLSHQKWRTNRIIRLPSQIQALKLVSVPTPKTLRQSIKSQLILVTLSRLQKSQQEEHLVSLMLGLRTQTSSSLRCRLYSLERILLYWTRRPSFWKIMNQLKHHKRNVALLNHTLPIPIKA